MNGIFGLGGEKDGMMYFGVGFFRAEIGFGFSLAFLYSIKHPVNPVILSKNRVHPVAKATR